ncbi:MAG: phosphoglucosamine mutase [Candidatus Eremiobacteraeota bacterium]|nr:phosphoglucosamine mutase [Candidatus Eremiobacteraeota bacterium]
MKVSKSMRISYSGIRGIVGESLTPEVAWGFGRAFMLFLQRRTSLPTILLARDTRPHGEVLQGAIVSGLATGSCRIRHLGIVATPTIQQALSDFDADAGIMITASHNPPEWNGFKFFISPENTILDGEQMNELMEIYQQMKKGEIGPPELMGSLFLGGLNEGERSIQIHLNKVLRHVNVDFIKEMNFQVQLDGAQGAGEIIGARILDRLGCDYEILRTERNSEPIPENIKELCQVVKKRSCDVGFAQDLDGDRLALVTEKGMAVGEQYTLALVTKHLLEKYREYHPVIVRNSSTSHMIDDLAKEYSAKLIETKVGEINLSRTLANLLKERKLAFGGEGNGGVIFPPISLGRDSIITMAFILEYMAIKDRPLSELVNELPKYYRKKIKLPKKSSVEFSLYEKKIGEIFPDGKINTLDGIKVLFSDGSWVQVRPSNTEPVIRILAESKDEGVAGELVTVVESVLSGI